MPHLQQSCIQLAAPRQSSNKFDSALGLHNCLQSKQEFFDSIAYSRALIASKVPVAMFMYPTGGHGWGYRDDFKYKRQWTGELEKWLRERILK